VTDSAKTHVYKPRAGLWDLESIECQVSADASDALLPETAMIHQDQIEKWEAHPGR
jgi:hypothetical protein